VNDLLKAPFSQLRGQYEVPQRHDQVECQRGEGEIGGILDWAVKGQTPQGKCIKHFVGHVWLFL
jgi:hypothetical protein